MFCFRHKFALWQGNFKSNKINKRIKNRSSCNHWNSMRLHVTPHFKAQPHLLRCKKVGFVILIAKESKGRGWKASAKYLDLYPKEFSNAVWWGALARKLSLLLNCSCFGLSNVPFLPAFLIILSRDWIYLHCDHFTSAFPPLSSALSFKVYQGKKTHRNT